MGIFANIEWNMDPIHHPGSSNKCWIQEKWRQLNWPIAAVDTPQKTHNLNLV